MSLGDISCLISDIALLESAYGKVKIKASLGFFFYCYDYEVQRLSVHQNRSSEDWDRKITYSNKISSSNKILCRGMLVDSTD